MSRAAKVKMARDCWARDLSVEEAYHRIESELGILPLYDIGEVYEEQDEAFGQWLVMQARAARGLTA